MALTVDERDSIDIETSGNAVIIDMHGRTTLSIHVRGDGAADYAVDVRDSEGGSWVQDAGPTYTGAANYDDVVTTGAHEVRLRCTTGTATAGDAADVFLSAGGT